MFTSLPSTVTSAMPASPVLDARSEEATTLSRPSARALMELRSKRAARRELPDGWPSPRLAQAVLSCRSSYAGKRVLVTEAFGFLGGHLARALQACDASVAALDADVSGSRESQIDLAGLRERLEVHDVNASEMSAVCHTIREGRFNFIFHVAPTPDVAAIEAGPRPAVVASMAGFVNFAECALRLPAHERPVVALVSAPAPCESAIYESARHAAEAFAASHYAERGLQVLVARGCGLFGPYDFSEEHGPLPAVIRGIFGAEREAAAEMRGAEREYCYVEDAARTILLLARETWCRGRVFDLPSARLDAATAAGRDGLQRTALFYAAYFGCEL